MGCAASRYGIQENASTWQRFMEESRSRGEGHGSSKEIFSPLDPPTINKENHEMKVSHDHDQDQEDDLNERRISNFDASNLVGSPSFREYCQHIQSSSDDENDHHDDEKVTNEMTPQEVCETKRKTSSSCTKRRLRSVVFAISNVRNIFNPSRQT